MKLLSIGLLMISFSALAQDLSKDGEGPGNNLRLQALSKSKMELVIGGAEATQLYNFLKVKPVKSENEGVLIIEKKSPAITCRHIESEEGYVGEECVIQINSLGTK